VTCPRHAYCAFTGDEKDRCWFCHTPLAAVLRCNAPCCRRDFFHHLRHHEHADAKAIAHRVKGHR